MKATIWICASFLFISCSSIQIDIDPKQEIKIDYSYLFKKSISLIESDIIALDDSLLYISRDLGRSWTQGPRLGDGQIVRMAYLFKDGTLFYCTDDKCFYSNDYVTVKESCVVDVNDEAFIPTSPYHSFSVYEHDAKRVIIEDTEVLCWGNYNNEESINPGFIPRIWITVDNGKTVKCTFKFGSSLIDKRAINTRHIHAVNYNKADSSFWASTGDDALYSHWLKGKYNTITKNIDWELVGTGIDYKTGNIQFYDDWIYASRDSHPGGVMRIRYNDAKDMSKKELLFQTPNDCLSVYLGKKGDIVAIMTTTGGSKNPCNIYYSTDQKTFAEIEVPIPRDLLEYGYSIFYNTWGINEDGYLLTGIRTRGKTPLSQWDTLPCIWLNDIIRDSGYPRAFL